MKTPHINSENLKINTFDGGGLCHAKQSSYKSAFYMPEKGGEEVNSVKEKLIEIAGEEHVTDDPETLAAYSRDQSFTPPMKPRFVVKPENADEVQAIVKWANETRTPLVPVSSGPPHFRGDTVPGTVGAVVVDLNDMKRIIRIDSRNRMVIIEPGVTFGQLQPELAREGLRLSMPLFPRRNKSVIASLIEREPILIPRYQWTLLEPLRCLEVVWGSGGKLRTGEAGEYGPLEEQWKLDLAQVWPMGPGQLDYYRLVAGAQGSMGIVTWATIKCELLPQLRKLFFVPSERLENLLDFAYRLLRFRYGDEFLFLNSFSLASILREDYDQIRALSDELPPWMLILGVAGRERLPRERVEFQEKDISEISRQFDLKVVPRIAAVRDGEVLEALLNPSREPYWKLRSRGGCQDIFFLTTLNNTPKFAGIMYSISQESGYPPNDISIYIQPLMGGVACHCEFNLPFDPARPEEVTRVQELLARASEALANQGAFFSRPYGIWADTAYRRDAQNTAVLRKVKGIFDPNNVMNPGKLCF
jgi:FAD/FMN-containing dehydrogenase